ncbi:hypothetical protein ACFO5K_10370 [Nocardia halotolerans]|uniref:Uncharacterized protein n=1 Tax=Nocardia halotolerans TaxID=1755878 RepID=A0ABV8VI80_9NOCA
MTEQRFDDTRSRAGAGHRGAAHTVLGRRLAAADREDHARLAVAAEFYPRGLAHYARAELTFLGWEIDRGVLHPDTGSPWWRALNDRLLTDKMEAGLGASASRTLSPSSRHWQRFLAAPSASNWYLAHNHSIVAGYLEHEHLARSEPAAERLMMNVTLARVLFAHLLVQRPMLAAGVWGLRCATPPTRAGGRSGSSSTCTTCSHAATR